MVSYSLINTGSICQPISEVKIDLGRLYRVGKIEFFNSGPGAEWSRSIYHCLKSCVECTTNDYALLSSGAGNLTWTGDIITRCARGIVSYTYGCVQLNVYELLYTTFLSISSDKMTVAYPDNQFIISGTVRDQYNNLMINQTVNITVTKDTITYFSGTAITDTNGNFTKTIFTVIGQTLWPTGTYVVTVTSDSISQSLNIQTYESGNISFNSICSDTGQSCPANVYVDDNFVGTTPIIVTLPVGDHIYRITKTGYIDVTGTQTVQFLITSPVNVVLNKQPNTMFNTSPQGAHIIINGADTGLLTPNSLYLNPGIYDYVLSLSCYENITGQFTITLGSIEIIDKVFATNTGDVLISSNPTGATVFINSIMQPGATPLNYTCIAEGTYSYTIYLAGYQSYIGSYTVVRNTITDINPTLLPLGAPETGSLYISSIPSGASIYVDGILQLDINGQPIITPATITGLTIGPHMVTLKYDGYYTLQFPVVIEENVTIDIHQILTLSTEIPVVAEGCVSFGGTPQGAHIIIDGIDTGLIIPAIICGLSLGSHTYQLSLEGYQSITGTTTLGTGQGNNISTDLVQYGNVTFTTIPPGAEIWLAPTGQSLIDQQTTTSPTGTTITNLFPGIYDYKLTLAEYQDSTGEFTVISGQTTILPPITLSPIQGGVTITSTPSGASIYIDDIPQGTTPNTIMGYNPGIHIYRLTYPEYIDATGTFEIISDQTISLDVVLTLATGSLDISSTPPGASIYIDDILQSEVVTPTILTGILPGTHTYKLTLTGYQDKIGNFDVTDSLTTTISETLEPMVVQAGMGGAGMFLIAGLVLGAIYVATKEKKEEVKIQKM